MVTRIAPKTAPISFPVWSSEEHSDLDETVPLTAREASDQDLNIYVGLFYIVTLLYHSFVSKP